MIKRANLAKSESEFTRAYENPRGVDFSEISKSNTRFAYLENMYVDYDGGADAVESIPGFRKIFGYGAKINGIHLQELGERGRFLIVHAGTRLYRLNVSNRDKISNQSPIATLSDTKSHSFSIGHTVYVMDGKAMIYIDGLGVARYVSDDGTAPPYVPTIYENAEKKEERNLLTDRYVQRFKIEDAEKYLYYTKELNFAINDLEKRTCSLMGMPSNFSGSLYIPATTIIDGVEYKVTEVAPYAFLGHKGITAIYGGKNLEYIGKYAFKNCLSLEYAVFHDSLKYIDYSAFCNSSAFTEIYIGVGFQEFAEDAIVNCDIQCINYSGDERDAKKIKGIEQFSDATLNPFSTQSDVRLALPVLGDVATVDEVLVNGEVINHRYVEQYREININFVDKRDVYGTEIVINGKLNVGELSGEAILGCTVNTVYDGRVFLSGNPKLPGYVFYSQEKPIGKIFFSESNYFIDGINNYQVTSMVSANGTLAVFKSDDDGSGCIFCHTAALLNGKKEYPVSYTHGGISNKSSSFVISDDTVFLSDRGLCALEKSTGSGYKELRTRSTNVNRRLLGEDLSSVKMTEWCGYLVLCAGERFYLADSRSRYKTAESFEYEWYFLNGIGTYSEQQRVYRYSPNADGAFEAKPFFADRIAEGVVMSVGREEGGLAYYVEEDGVKYSVYPTDEYADGAFSPARCALGTGKLLFFGTESGDLCIFNNDKRGVAPNHVAASDDFDGKEYAELMGDKIHPYFYSFNGRAAKYCLKTASDDCGVPHLTKSTVKHSLVLKCKTYAESSFNISAITDHGRTTELGGYTAGRMTFNDINFANLDFSTAPYAIIPIPENERGWVEKQLVLYGENFRAPFGICSFTYRYKIKGKLKYV